MVMNQLLVTTPKVAFSSPPQEGPRSTAISSVASPIQPARGKIARAAVIKIVSSPHCSQRAIRARKPIG